MKTIFCAAIIASAAGCGAPATSSAPPGVDAPNARGPGNIYWRPIRLNLPYPTKSRAEAVLTYWGPDGYYTQPPYCKGDATFSATPHRHYGNPSKYMHVVYWFKALSRGPDDCAFTAVLDNTGSPPIAILKLHVQGK